VGRNEAIRINEDFDTQPDERNIDDRRGVHRWVLDLDARSASSLKLGYKVAYPEEAELQGL
jgi:hypothetical protein